MPASLSSPGRVSPETALALQRTMGNAAVSRLISEEETVQEASGAAVSAQPEAPVQRSGVESVLASPGTPLADSVRTDMEARLGADFSGVRLHTGPAARDSAAEIGARAYTSGDHVVIGDGGADPHTLAHELTHVIQQRQGPVAGTDNGSGLSISDPSDRFEREAEANAHRALSGPVQRASDEPDDAPLQRMIGNREVSRLVEDRKRSVQRIEFPSEAPNEMLERGYWLSQAGGAKKVLDHKEDRKSMKKGTARPLSGLVSGVALDLLRKLDGEKGKSGRLELYRGMGDREANAVVAWAKGENEVNMREKTESFLRGGGVTDKDFHNAEKEGNAEIIPLGSHLGGKEQASEYAQGGRLLKFVLKPGAHKYLFDPQYAALGPTGIATSAIDQAYGGQARHPIASGAEAGLGGYIGIKSEKQGFFSITLGNAKDKNKAKSIEEEADPEGKASQLLFQLFLESVEEVPVAPPAGKGKKKKKR